MEIKRDRHFYPVTIGISSRIKIDDTEVSLTAGTYYTHQDSTLHSNGYPSIYTMICLRLNAVLGGTWKFFPITPSGYKLRSSVRLRKLTGAAPTSIDFSETDATIQRVMGFSGSRSDVVSFDGVNLDGELAAYGSWSPYSFFDRRADVKDSWMDRVTNWSSTHPEVAQAVIWRERKMRLLSYPYVFGSYINQDRASFDALAEQAGMAKYDYNNSLQNLWTIHGRDLESIIVAYDMDELDIVLTSYYSYEIVKFSDVAQAQSMDKLASRLLIGADVWNVKIIYTIVGGTGYGL